MLRPIVPLLVLLGVASTLDAQPRGRDRTPPRGTAVIRGTVVIAGGDATVPRLTILAIPWQGAHEGMPHRYEGISDESGSFEIAGLPAGRYRLFAEVPRSRADLVASWLTPSPGNGPKVELADGEVVEKVVVSVLRAGVIVGRVLNEFGEPVPYARVLALQRRAGALQHTSMGLPRETDDRGRFRLFGLPPGEHYIKVEPAPGFDRLGPDDRVDPVQHLETYYPGVPTAEDAQPIHVAAGQEVGDIEIPLRRGRTFQVSGVVLDSRGAPAGRAQVMFFAKGQGSGEMTEPDGTFVIRRLPPGEYAFHATSETFPTNEEREESEPITLQVDSDMDGLTLPMRRAVKVAGRVVVEGDPPLVHPASIQILATPQRGHMMGGPNIISVREDGTFTARLVHKTLLRLNDAGGKWFLKAVRYKGADVTDVPTEFGESSDASQLELVLTNRGGRIAGRVIDPDGSPVVAGLVLVFAQDQRVWFPAASTTQAQGIEQNGRFEISGLRPESYYIMAVPSAEEALPELMTDPRKLFEKLAPLATRVEITGDERREVTLTVNK